ncbi:alginate export family protein, partial [Flavitalea antarctica]
MFNLLTAFGQNEPAFKPRILRFDETYSRQPDTTKNKEWLRIKSIPLNRSGYVRAAFGLDYREMYERVQGYDSGGVKDGYWLTRFMIHADLLFGKRWRTFVQLGRGLVTEKDLRIAPVDEDRLFLLNAFGEYRFGKGGKSYIRAGRQELFFGMGRLIAPREGPNVRSTYDGLRTHFVQNDLSADAFFAYIVNNRPGIFDNDVLGNNQQLWGLYGSKKVVGINADFYYLGFYNPSASYTKQPHRAR